MLGGGVDHRLKNLLRCGQQEEKHGVGWRRGGGVRRPSPLRGKEGDVDASFGCCIHVF